MYKQTQQTLFSTFCYSSSDLLGKTRHPLEYNVPSWLPQESDNEEQDGADDAAGGGEGESSNPVVGVIFDGAADGTACEGSEGAECHHGADAETNVAHVGGCLSDAGRTEGDEAAGEEAEEDGEDDHGGERGHPGPADGDGACEEGHEEEDVEAMDC